MSVKQGHNFKMEHNMKKKITLIMVVAALGMTGCGASWNRAIKSWNSEVEGGLNRTLVVYDYNGDKLKEYSGKIDIEVSASNDKILFDLNGKRHIIRGGIVIIDEQ